MFRRGFYHREHMEVLQAGGEPDIAFESNSSRCSRRWCVRDSLHHLSAHGAGRGAGPHRHPFFTPYLP